ncbi:MAG: hypothetical protein PUC94_00805 [Bacteroidales bacterium]|nr:hypothetical protein [Bacteroidales bacterium]MDD6723278.1 hypothetical protein [Bacteroidales bacterium]
MNTKIFFSLMAAAAVSATLNGCDDNAWNDKLDGFKDKENEPLTEVQTIEYTMTDADYASVSSNKTNQALAGEDLANALANVGKQKCFSEQIPAEDYAPALLASKYYYLDNGSAVNLTYRQSVGLPAYLADAAAAELYTVTEDDYKNTVWESAEDYVNGFAPSKPASRYLSRILAANVSDDAGYCIVSYNQSNQEPVFGNVGGGQQPEPWKPGNTIGQATLNADIEAQAVVTGICAQGYIVTDASGSILVYMGSSFDASSVQIGQQLNITGVIGAYNKGLQITGSSATVEVVGTQKVTYPSAEVVNGAKLDELGARTDNELAKYITITGKVVVSGNNINIEVDGAATTKGSVYQGTPAQKALFTDGATVTVTGWFIAVAGGNRYANMVVTAVDGKPVAAAPRHRAAAVEVPMTAHNAVYTYTDGRWSEATDFVVLQPGDYTDMGQKYQNLTNANQLLPTYLKQKFPYAAAEAVKNVLYLYFNSATKETYYICDQYVYNGSEWTLNNGIETVTRQFVKNAGKWMYDPSVVITLPSGRNQAFSATYYQACVDWVYENICVPLGDTSITSGLFYVSKYGNNDYYSGASAYQNNVDIRGASAREQYAAGFEGMTDDQISELIKKRFFEEVFPAAISKIHADVEPIPGLDYTYTFNFYAYNGSTIACQAVYKVVGKGQFEPVKCVWGIE